MPLAVEQLDVTGYDVVVSSNHAVAKGVVVGPDQLHVSYVHSPIRYAWDLQHQYLAEAGMRRGVKGALDADWSCTTCGCGTSRRPRASACSSPTRGTSRGGSSTSTAARHEVIYPPVDVDSFPLQTDKSDYYLAASRMVPYKRMPLIAEAFARHLPGKKLVMVGGGTELDKARAAAGPNVRVMGHQPFGVLRDLMRSGQARWSSPPRRTSGSRRSRRWPAARP